MIVSNKTQLLTVIATKPVLQEVEGVGKLYFKKLTVAEQGELSKRISKDDKNDTAANISNNLMIIAYSLCDEHGKRLLGDNEVDELSKMETDTLTKIVDVINKINGFDEKAKDVKKN